MSAWACANISASTERKACNEHTFDYLMNTGIHFVERIFLFVIFHLINCFITTIVLLGCPRCPDLRFIEHISNIFLKRFHTKCLKN